MNEYKQQLQPRSQLNYRDHSSCEIVDKLTPDTKSVRKLVRIKLHDSRQENIACG